MSYKSELKEINVPAPPSAGCKMKIADDYNDSLNKGYKGNVQTEFEAKETKGAAIKAVNIQIGRTNKDAGEGHADTTERTLHNSDCPCCS
jgi:hypothetical protein